MLQYAFRGRTTVAACALSLVFLATPAAQGQSGKRVLVPETERGAATRADADGEHDNEFDAGQPLETVPRHRWIPIDKPRQTSAPAAFQMGIATTVQVNVAQNRQNILGDAANEPSLAIDPSHPLRMVIGWRQFDTVLSDFRQAGWAYSNDGGRTWRFPGVLDPGVFRSDPVLDADAQGNFYYSSLTSNFGSLLVDFFVSNNGGSLWSGPISAWGGDKQWFTVDRSGGIGDGNLYQSWSTAGGPCCGSNIFTRSTTGAASWSQPVGVPSTPRWGTMAVDRHGTLYLAGVSGSGQFIVAKSTTVQNPAFLPAFDSSAIVNMGGTIAAQVGGFNPNPAGLLGQAWIAADPSDSPTADWVYLVCSVNPPGPDPMDVMFSHSRNGGVTWSAPRKLNDDATQGWQWGATMSVAPNGRIDVVWNDTRATGVANRSALFYTSSTDGGNYWTPNVQLSPEWDSHVGWPQQQKIGDYSHMVSDITGASLAWAATFNGEQDVWFTRIGEPDCNGDGVSDTAGLAQGIGHDHNANGILDECEGLVAADSPAPAAAWRLLQNAPNPFNPTTRIGFVAPPEGGHAQVDIFDVRGRRIRTLRAEAGPGPHDVVWDGADDRGRAQPSGVYAYRLQAAGFSETRRMVLAR